MNFGDTFFVEKLKFPGGYDCPVGLVTDVDGYPGIGPRFPAGANLEKKLEFLICFEVLADLVGNVAGSPARQLGLPVVYLSFAYTGCIPLHVGYCCWPSIFCFFCVPSFSCCRCGWEGGLNIGGWVLCRES